jgi:hypothetical protein
MMSATPPPHSLAGPEAERSLLRHTLATLAYRGGKAVRDAPDGFADHRAVPSLRTPVEILAHVGDLLDWALGLADGRHVWHDAPPRPWEEEVARFHEGLAVLDERLAAPQPLGFSAERIFQGPLADALTHVGQITLLRRMAGAPVRGENYFKADIAAGRVGAEQAPPRREFE